MDVAALDVDERVTPHAQTVKGAGENYSTLAKRKAANARRSRSGIPNPVVADCSELGGSTGNVHCVTTFGANPHIVRYCKFYS